MLSAYKKGIDMSFSFKNLTTPSKIRIVLFICLLIWAVYCFIAYSTDLNNGGKLSDIYINTSDINDIYVDGSDLTWAMRLMGIGLNGMITVMVFFILLFLMVAETLLVLVPTLLLRIIGLNKKLILTVSKDEFKITKTIFLLAICISLILEFAITGFIAIIPKLILCVTWILLCLIYVNGLKHSVEKKELIELQRLHESNQQ